MKVKFLLALIFSAICGVSTAQSYYLEDERTFYGGLILGGTFSQVDGDNFRGYSKMGITGGATAFVKLNTEVAFCVEILYTQKGAKSKLANNSNTWAYRINEYQIDLNYAEIPLLLNYYIKRKSHFGGGFSYGQLIGLHNETIKTSPVYPDPLDLPKDYPFRKFDVNFILNASFHIYKGLYLNGRFQYSVVPVRINAHPEFGRDRQSNNMLALRLMYLFE